MNSVAVNYILLVALTTVVVARPQTLQDIDCVLRQRAYGNPSFQIDAWTDPILAFKAKKRHVNLPLKVTLNHHVLHNHMLEVKSCAKEKDSCLRFYVPSELKTFRDHVHDKECPKSAKIDPENGTWPNCLPGNNSSKIQFEFADYDPVTNAEILYVRTNHCGQYSWNRMRGEWISDEVENAMVNIEPVQHVRPKKLP